MFLKKMYKFNVKIHTHIHIIANILYALSYTLTALKLYF